MAWVRAERNDAVTFWMAWTSVTSAADARAVGRVERARASDAGADDACAVAAKREATARMAYTSWKNAEKDASGSATVDLSESVTVNVCVA